MTEPEETLPSSLRQFSADRAAYVAKVLDCPDREVA